MEAKWAQIVEIGYEQFKQKDDAEMHVLKLMVALL